MCCCSHESRTAATLLVFVMGAGAGGRAQQTQVLAPSHAGVWGQMAPDQLLLLPEAEQEPACGCDCDCAGLGACLMPGKAISGEQPRPGWVG